MAPTAQVESWATSISSDNVQALAAVAATAGPTNVPERYIRPGLDVAAVVAEGDEMVPIIDMRRLLHPSYSHDESAKLHSACMTWGFFQLVNHGIADGVMERMKTDLEEFFQLPLEEKNAFAPLPDGLQGYGQKLILAEEKLEWQDMIFLYTLPPHARNMRFWPTSPPTFRSTLDNYSKELASIANILFEVMGKNLGLHHKAFCEIFTFQTMRMNYYPPCSKPDEVLGINPHSDAGGLTFLLQVRDVPGLQIKRSGKWLLVRPLEHALVVNVGDSLEIASNGKYRSIEHRAIVNNKKERLSIAAYHSTNFESMIGPLPEFLEGEEPRYKTMTYREYLQYHFSANVEGKSHMEFMITN